MNEDQERYLKAKEVMNCTIKIGQVIEQTCDEESLPLLEDVLDVLTRLFYDEYYELKETIEPENIHFNEGMRYF